MLLKHLPSLYSARHRLSCSAPALLLLAILPGCHKEPSANTSNAQIAAAPANGAAPYQFEPPGGDPFAPPPTLKVDCAQAHPQSAPSGALPDDILGVRAGMAPVAASAVLGCASPAYLIHPDYGQSNFGTPPMPDGTRANTGFNAARSGPDGADQVGVLYVGLPGKETVAGLSRQIDFPPGKQPTINTVHSGLIAKYGMPDLDATVYGGDVSMAWVRGPNGKPLERNSSDFQHCTVQDITNGMLSASPVCGAVVQAKIVPSGDNKDAARRLQIGTVDEARTYAIAAADTQTVKAMRGSGGTVPKL